MSRRRIFAVIPAAGHSRRMGQPKLMLPVGKTTVIGCVLTALQEAGLGDIAIVTRRGDDALIAEIRRHGVEPVLPEFDPPEMRDSIEQALDWIERTYTPTVEDAWLLLPADHPVLHVSLLQRIIEVWPSVSTDVLIPTCDGRRGHPLIARWTSVAAIRQLPRDVGVNAWLRDPATTVTELPLDDPRILCDLDRPEDYARLLSSITM